MAGPCSSSSGSRSAPKPRTSKQKAEGGRLKDQGPAQHSVLSTQHSGVDMATKAWVAKQLRRSELAKRYIEVRKQLKKEKNYAGLAKLPRDSSPTRSHSRCQLTGRGRGYLRKFKI